MTLNDVEEVDSEIMVLTKELLEKRFNLALVKRKRKILLEELHRQCLEGEVDPKKRMKASLDRLKKSRISLVHQIVVSESADHVGTVQDDVDDQQEVDN